MPLERYQFRLAESDLVLETDGRQVFLDGLPVDLSIVPIGPSRFSVIHEGRCHTLSVEEVNAYAMTIRTGGGLVEMTWKDRKSALLESMGYATRTGSSHTKVVAPMPGLVLNVLVQDGQEVSTGDALVVLEAMKMENELRAAAPGRVARVHVAAGDAVSKGAVLIEFDA